jgi:hypothetical protein
MTSAPLNASRTMNRHFTSAKLWGLFVESGKMTNDNYNKNEHKIIFQKTVYQILLRPDLFGGDCNIYRNENYKKHNSYPDLLNEDVFVNGCSPFIEGKTKVNHGSESALFDLRAGKILENVCQDFLTATHKEVTNFYARNFYIKAGINIETKVSINKLKKVYKVFYPTLKMNMKEINFFINNLPTRMSYIEQMNLFSLILCRSQRLMLL